MMTMATRFDYSDKGDESEWFECGSIDEENE